MMHTVTFLRTFYFDVSLDSLMESIFKRALHEYSKHFQKEKKACAYLQNKNIYVNSTQLEVVFRFLESFKRKTVCRLEILRSKLIEIMLGFLFWTTFLGA